MKKVMGVSLVAAAFCISGCASILNDSTQTVNVTSSNGATISGTVNGQPFTAPGIVKLERTGSSQIFITNTEGCVKETAVENSVDSKFFINIFSGGAFGSSTDFSTGRMWKYAENVTINCGK